MVKRVRSRKGAPGIVEVAQKAGVSPATVSRYFNSPDVVKPHTRERIRVAAEEMGYIRNRMAGTMHNRSSGTIGLIVPTINNAIFSELIDAFSNQLRVHDRTMLIASHNYDLDQEESLIRSLLERRIDGIALVGQDHNKNALSILRAHNVPTLAVWGYQPNAQLPFIGADNTEAGMKVTQHLIDLGHQDIAFLFPDTVNNDRARDRKEGALRCMLINHLHVPDQRKVRCSYNLAEAKGIALQLLSTNPPTAIVCGNDIIAHGVIYAAQQQGLSIPEELSVVGIGDFPGSAEISPALTTVRIPAKRIGQLAAASLVELSVSDRHEHSLNRVIETALLVRQSTCTPTNVVCSA